MFNMSNLILLTLLSLPFLHALPTATTQDPASRTAQSTTTHTIAVGRGGLRFEPDNVVADLGSVLEFHYLPRNHSVAQSSFDKPCVPLGDKAIFSGFRPVAAGQNEDVFQVTVKDTNPLWFYCSQTAGSHCQKGMNMAVNQVFDSAKTLKEYRVLAGKTNTSVSPAAVGGGVLLKDPNVLGGL